MSTNLMLHMRFCFFIFHWFVMKTPTNRSTPINHIDDYLVARDIWRKMTRCYTIHIPSDCPCLWRSASNIPVACLCVYELWVCVCDLLNWKRAMRHGHVMNTNKETDRRFIDLLFRVNNSIISFMRLDIRLYIILIRYIYYWYSCIWWFWNEEVRQLVSPWKKEVIS